MNKTTPPISADPKNRVIVAARIGGGTEPTPIALIFAQFTGGRWAVSCDSVEQFEWRGDHRFLDERMANIAAQVQRMKALSWRDCLFVVDATLEPSYEPYRGRLDVLQYKAKVTNTDTPPRTDDQGRHVYGRMWLLSNAKRYLHPDPQGLPGVTFRRFAYAPDVQRALLEVTSKPPTTSVETFSDAETLRRENMVLSVCLALAQVPDHVPASTRTPKVIRSARTHRA